ncbi:MAG: imidazoleglycerol-phosphate dehydratase HisB [Methanoregula sp.]|jgi:imidazoleglycerol-phosphate dehydratase|nr:imidazoleglycerol-phosphate dehydratase HisB [Methanoregula sp.]
MRKVDMNRSTKETQIRLLLTINGKGTCTVKTGIPFFDHMLHAMAKHGGFDLECRVKGDLGVDTHHTIEDTGIVLGDAIKQAIGDGKGIRRFAHAIIPMDESIATVALDCGGRGYLVFSGSFGDTTVGGIPSEIVEHFFYSLCTRAGITAHITFSGRNDHHQCEAIFKAFGIALSGALAPGKGKAIPSTKGKL